jgi:hypothetical protein
VKIVKKGVVRNSSLLIHYHLGKSAKSTHDVAGVLLLFCRFFINFGPKIQVEIPPDLTKLRC